jgi:hypothetical protein
VVGRPDNGEKSVRGTEISAMLSTKDVSVAYRDPAGSFKQYSHDYNRHSPGAAQDRERSEAQGGPLRRVRGARPGRKEHELPHAALGDGSTGSGAGSAAPKRCAGYVVYEPLGQKIGDAEELFVDWDGEPQYIRVRIGFFGTKSVLIPVRFVETDEDGKVLVLK